MQPGEILEFQVERQIKSLYKDCLILLEDRDEYIKKLENILVEIGLEAYKNSPVDYQKDRKFILYKGNDKIRELQEFIKTFSIKLNKHPDEYYNK